MGILNRTIMGFVFLLTSGVAEAQTARLVTLGIAANSFSSSQGISLSGDDLTGASRGDTATYSNLDFGAGVGAIDFTIAVPPETAGMPIEIRLGSATGTLIGTLSAASTGSSRTFKVQRAAIQLQSGVKSVVLRFPGSRVFGVMDRFVGVATSGPTNPTPTPTPSTPTPTPQPTTPTNPPTASCTLQSSGPITVTRNGQIIENLYIKSNGTPAISIDGFSDVVIRNVRIEHANAPGISFDNAHRLKIQNVSVLYSAAPARGALPGDGDEYVNIEGDGSNDVQISNVRVEKGASGIRFLNSLRPRISMAEGHDFRGPFPRGQFVQLDKSHDGIIEDFYTNNPSDTAWTEDNINIFNSSNAIIRRGVIDGNNSPSGIGVIFEQLDDGVSGGLVEDVDAIHMGNGCFSAYPGTNITFNRTRCTDNICTSQQGRGAPLSNALCWAGLPGESSGLKLLDSSYQRFCNAGNTVWDRSTFSTIQLTERSFTTRTPVRAKFCWQ